MKRIYSVNDSKVVLGLFSGLKSRITSIKPALYQVITPMLFVAFGLFGVNEKAWGGTWYAKIDAAADPSNGGYVYVGTKSDCSASNATKSTDDGENSASKNWQSSGDVNLWLCAKAKSGYIFKGWNTDQSNTVLSGSTAVPYKVTVHGTAKVFGIGGESYNYYAIFARMVANTPAAGSTTSFDDTNVGSESGWEQIKIDHAHAGTVTISQSGNAGDFFVGATTGATTELSSFESTTETTRTIYVKFVPQNNGLRTCTLTVSSNNGLSSLTYYLSGTGYNEPSITWVDGNGSELVSGETTLSAGDVLRATCTTGQTVSYSGFNTSYFTAGTDGDGNPILTVREDISGTINNLSVTANLAKKPSNFYAAYSETFTLNVTNLTPQTIEWTDDISDISDEEIGHTITLNAVAKNAKTGANSGQAITYSMVANDYLSLSGNVLTVKAIGGPVAITATATGNASYAPTSVTRYATVIDMSHPCAPSDSYNGKTLNKDNKSLIIYPTLPGKLTFNVVRSSSWFVLNKFTVKEYSSNNSLLATTEYNNSDISTSGETKTINCNVNTTKIEFYCDAYLSYSCTVSNVSTERVTTSSVSVNSLSYATDPGQSLGKQVSISYSNIPVFLSFKSDEDAHVSSGKSLWSLSTSHFGGCGKKGSQNVTVTFHSNAKGNYSDKLYVRNNVGDLLHTIDLSASVTAQEQFLDSWNIADAYNTTDQVTLAAATTVGNTDFTFTPTASNPANIVSITNSGVMTFTASGTATIRAYQPGDNLSNEFETSHNITISKVTPTIATNPTVATIKYLDNLNNNQLSEGLATVTLRGVANTPVAGAFEWTNTKQITDKAGDYTHSITFKPTNTGMYNNKVFDQTITISRADASIVMNDGSVKVLIAGVNDDLDECKIDLDGLIASQTTDAIAASRAGAVSYKVISGNAEYASIDGNHVFVATRPGEYTIEVTKAQTEWYEEAKDTFKVTVNKLDPVVVFDNTDNPQVIYTYDELIQPAARWYNGHEISRAIVYTSAEQKIVEVNNSSSKLTAKEVGNKEEGEYSLVTVSAYSEADDFYNESAVTEKNYKVHAKRSPVFEMDGVENAPVSKTLNIGETAIIRYNDFTDATLTVGTSGEHGYVTFELNRETREVTVTAVKGNLIGDGTQIITLTQPGNDDYYERQINYTFTVRRNVSTMSVEALPDNMQVEDTVSTIFTNLANTTDAIQFSCTPEGGMKMEDGKLIALQAGQYTVTFTQPNTEYWTGISQSKTITVSKINPQITWFSETSQPWYATVRNPFRSTNTMNDCPITITSSNETLAKYIAEDNKIVVYGTSGTVTFTLNQQGNYKYNPVVNAQKTITIFKPNNGLPFTLTSSNWTNYKNSNEGAISWDNGGVLCGEASGIGWGGAGWDWSAKYIILKFVGIPDTLSFDFQNANSAATQYGWHFYQSSTGNDNDWQVLKEYADALMNSDGGTSEGSEKLALHPDTRYLKLEYHGNFGGRFKNVSVTERKEITPQRATEDFGLGYNGNEPTDHILPVNWYNVNSCRVYIDGADADRFILTENTIYSNLNEYGTANLHVSYKHDANTATSHTATLYIVEELPNGKDGKTAQIALVGQTQPAPQVIIWRDDLTPMPSEGDFPGAAYSTSGLAITLTSLNPDIVSVGGEDGLTLYPVAAGIAQVQAYQAGNEKWAEVTDVLEIEVTNKQVQFITWNDNLSNLKRENGNTVTVTLHATASSNLEVTYELDEAASEFASVNGNVLTLTGWGTGTITAKQAGNADFVAVSKKKTLVSRNPNAGCRPLVGEYADEYTLHTIAFKEIELNGEPQTVEFDAKCDATALNGLLVAEFYDNYWHEIARIKRLEGNTITSSYKHFGPYDLQRTTTAVKIYSETGATMTRKFKNVEVTLAKYLELDRNEMNFSQMDMGATKIQSFYINYSNLTGALDVQLENSSDQFEVITTTVGEDCGDYAKNVRIDIMCTGKTAGLEENVIIVSNVNQTLRVPVSANVLKPTQAITWEPETNILTTDEVILAATATSELAVTYESKQPEIAEVVWNGEAWKLDIKKYGDVKITASQAGNESWSAATDKEITFHISRVVPTITEYPTADAIMLSFPLGGCALHGGAIAEDIQGSFRWADEEQIVTRETNIYQAMFAPDNQNYYAPVPFDIELEAIEDTQFITWDREEETYAHCADVIELEAVASSGLPIMYHSSDSLVAYVENGILKVIQAGTVTIQATQPGNTRYAAAEPISKQITLERNTLEVEKAPTASYVYVGHMLSDAKFENDGIVKAGDIVVDGTFTWEMDEKMPILGTYSRTAIFTPNNINWYIPTSCMVSVQVVSAYSYIGNGGWTLNKDYWRDGKRPDGDETPDDVAVEGTLTVTADDIIKVRDLNVSGTIILEEGARMTVTGNLVLEASLGGMDEDENVYPATSGQLIGDVFESIDVQGDVYFQISLDPSGQCSPGWYDFTVPFPVDVMTGITRLDNTTGEEKEIKNEVNYAIMDFSESRHIESHYGWKKFRGIMQPGQCYTITIDDIDNVYRFKKTTTGSFNNQKEEALAYTDSEVSYRGWNGLGNGTMSHVDLSATGISEVQIYNHLSNSYMPVDIDEFTYVVGASYFIQAPAANSILTYSEGTKSAEWYRAPKRNVGEGENKEFKLTLTREGSIHEADRLYIGATEDASDSYEIGRDLSKFGNPIESKVAQVWANAYRMKLCDIDMPLINDEASCPISLFAPKAGVYALEVKRAQDDADLYLTYNGEVIWDLTMSEYEFELSKGLTDGYGLKMVSHAPKVATGVDNADAESATMRKVIINDKIYVITPEGKMYDVIGKCVKY